MKKLTQMKLEELAAKTREKIEKLNQDLSMWEELLEIANKPQKKLLEEDETQ